MKLGKICFYTAIFICLISALVCWLVPFDEIFNVPDEVIVNNNTLHNEAKSNFGSLVTTRYNEKSDTVDFLLFDTVKIHSVNAINVGDKVYLGGDTLGFSYNGKGVLVIAKGENADENIMAGDIIKSINGAEIDSVNKITEILNKNEENNFEVTAKIVRKGNNIETKLKPAYDTYTRKYKLGIWAKESISGIGTLTFIDPNTGRFGALGHPILEPSTNTILDVGEGKVHKCCVLGVKRAIRGNPGELKGVFVRSNQEMGTVDKNCDYGMYGNLNLENKMFQNKQLIEVGGRLTAHPGKAQIYSSLDGKTIRAYDIEIIKTNFQSAQSPKNLIFKVTDNRLIETTGGIVQGMSGSPIVQDGKLIGAVTHVFVNDATKGFGIYIDNMIQQ